MPEFHIDKKGLTRYVDEKLAGIKDETIRIRVRDLFIRCCFLFGVHNCYGDLVAVFRTRTGLRKYLEDNPRAGEKSRTINNSRFCKDINVLEEVGLVTTAERRHLILSVPAELITETKVVAAEAPKASETPAASQQSKPQCWGDMTGAMREYVAGNIEALVGRYGPGDVADALGMMGLSDDREATAAKLLKLYREVKSGAATATASA